MKKRESDEPLTVFSIPCSFALVIAHHLTTIKEIQMNQ